MSNFILQSSQGYHTFPVAGYQNVTADGGSMYAREWKAICPNSKKDGFIKYLYETGVKDTSSTPGFQGAQIFCRPMEGKSEVTLISYWDSLESIKAFAGEEITVAKLYPEDFKYDLEPDKFVNHYEVVENKWL